MDLEQARKLGLIIRQAAAIAKRSIDEFADLTESAMMIFVKENKPQKELSSKSEKPGLLNVKELADRLGVSTRTISNLVSDGMKTKKIGRRILFDYEEVLNWIDGKNLKPRRKNNLRVVK